MSVVAAFIFPHPPIILPQIGKGEEKKIQKTIDSYREACTTIAQLKPDTIVLASSHCAMYSDYLHISSDEYFESDMSGFGAGSVSVSVKYDTEFLEKLMQVIKDKGIPAGIKGYEDTGRDHASVIPLVFLNEVYKEYRLIRMGISNLPFETHYKLGMCVSQAADMLDRRTVFIASGDLSHKLKVFGPYGYSKQGEQYDEIVTEAMKTGNFSKFMDFSDEFLEKAAECGHRTFIIMAGALDKKEIVPRLLSHEDTFGVGYAVASFIIKENELVDKNVMLQNTDEYVALARYSVEYFVKNNKRAMLPDKLSKELLKQKAGVFVTLKKDGDLRGCIGTITPAANCIAEEILQNAVSSCSRDPRFYPVNEEELDKLEYSVDVLKPAEKISSINELDVNKYGVIVTSGFRRGLLLPNLEGIDTVDQQVDISLRKAGIGRHEKYEMERFEVVRHK
ncbi:MAG TPA: AmmeMemoRadiSam system protein A [Clostridia bacterium]|nr:AmmeMemoRadiSam system protein A [Clostridia bacterium]HQO70174.1 AmmeMemoRadiSam system protein A [Clostridia bacterium]